ncbi:MAG TPA: trehalase family glycosidase, partial [Ktedonobacteraceae bacterium]|nr:trehalase family glycosidase [Ktedonobacteraceae bacterium]
SYVNNQFQYSAHLTIGLNINDLVLVTQEDFLRHRCTINSQLHTKNRFEYTCIVSQYELTLTIRYFLVQEHVLGCTLTLATTFPAPVPITCYLIHRHVHNPHTSRLWEHGLYALQDRQTGCGMLGLASEGDVFVHGARLSDNQDIANGPALTSDSMGFATSLDELSAWARGVRIPWPRITQRQPDTGWQHRALAMPYRLILGGSSPSSITLHAALARGVSQDKALFYWLEGMDSINEAESMHRENDESFWQQAPKLTGDWPAHWQRGFVYDFETLRMVTRPPASAIPHVWDGMQIQAPRTVLAEAAMDTLFLSYADPELAAEVILGHFESAPHPNLPCMREDGSFNMVADDGQICGTAPEWGYPLWCCQQLWLRSGDLSWLKRLYPGAAAYLRWWLDHRRDSEGWEIYGCSWESGQDVSIRFGPQQTGGTIIQHLRPVDLQASIAQGAAILASWAEILSSTHADETLPNPYTADIAFWQEVANEFTVKTRLMWQNGWFRDYDSVRGIWSSEQDAMHLAPVFCGVAEREHIEQLRPALAQPPSNNPHWLPLSWPPIIMTVAEAARLAGMSAEAVELAYRFVDASYRSADNRTLDEYGNIPGVTRENRRAIKVGKWGEIDYVNAGIEGYGWGAVSIHLLIRHLLGMYATGLNSITLAPTLPLALRRPGATYTIAPIPWGKYLLSLTCRVKSAHSYEATFHVRPRAQAAQPAGETEARSETAGEQEHHWEGAWGEECTFLLDH